MRRHSACDSVLLNVALVWFSAEPEAAGCQPPHHRTRATNQQFTQLNALTQPTQQGPNTTARHSWPCSTRWSALKSGNISWS